MSAITQEVLDELKQEVFDCERVLDQNEDFLISDVPVAMDGIKWFVQEYLPVKLKKVNNDQVHN